jgi:hypothetical protein
MKSSGQRIKTLVSSLITTVLLFGCGQSLESKAIEFYRYLEKGEVSKALEMVSEEERKLWGGKLVTALAGISKQIQSCQGFKEIKADLDKEDQSDSLKKYRLRMRFNDPDKKGCHAREESITFVKLSGKWYVNIVR